MSKPTYYSLTLKDYITRSYPVAWILMQFGGYFYFYFFTPNKTSPICQSKSLTNIYIYENDDKNFDDLCDILSLHCGPYLPI